MSSAFVLAPLTPELPALVSEAQEVINILSAAGWTVQLMQDPATRLDLYRIFNKEQYDLGWVGAHSGTDAWALIKEVLPPDVLGNFIDLACCTNLVLNSCFSVQHVDAIQVRGSRCNIVATINPEGIEDREAWAAALPLVKRFVRSGDLRMATRQAGGQYRWFPAPGVDDGDGMDNKAVEERLRRNEETVARLVRALQGDEFTRRPGLIDTLSKHQEKMELYIEKNEERWEQAEKRFEQRATIVMSPQTALTATITIVFFLILVLVAARLGAIGGLP